MHTVDSTFPVFCFDLLIVPLKLFAWTPFSTSERTDTLTIRAAPKVLHIDRFSMNTMGKAHLSRAHINE